MNNPRLSGSSSIMCIGDKLQMEIAVSSGIPEIVASTLWKIPVLRSLCIRLLLNDIDTQCRQLIKHSVYAAKVSNH